MAFEIAGYPGWTVVGVIGAIIAVAVYAGLVKVGSSNKKKAMVVGAIMALAGASMTFGWLSGLTGGGVTVCPQSFALADGKCIPIDTLKGTSCQQQTDGTNSLNVVAKNKLNPTETYIGHFVYAVDDAGTQLTTGVTTAGSSISYATLSVAPCKNGFLYFTGNSSKKVEFSSNAMTSDYVVETALGNSLSIAVFDSTLTGIGTDNTTDWSTTNQAHGETGSSFFHGQTVYANLTIGAGASKQFFIDLQQETANSEYGSCDAVDGLLVDVYFPDLTKMTTNDLSLSSQSPGYILNEVACPKDINNNRKANKCWSGKSVKSGDGVIRLSGVLHCSLGDCSVGDEPVIAFENQQFFSNNGKMTYGVYNDAGTYQGQTATVLTINTI